MKLFKFHLKSAHSALLRDEQCQLFIPKITEVLRRRECDNGKRGENADKLISMVDFDGQLAAGTCEIVTLNKDSSQPRRTIARQTARCACKKGQIAGTTRARPACVDAGIVRKRQWCEMVPCLEDEGCDLLVNKSGWTCTQPGGRVKTTTAL
ncbi:chemokine-like protein TAFA-5a isoform X1 [Poecilia reticulata]|uniref:chemokine-like protein TAFA-5a isoform X1 n=1 Tax=Poecilia reticulata TaxID=8081 RepID=UPI0004A3C495|nr:PREDICTED: protein FAM19A5 isoform X1 [Poecilia reticulata]XP_008399367.1 PREDICTED: protein FAM19A5 isoform X1 [Poecilia reticulata]